MPNLVNSQLEVSILTQYTNLGHAYHIDYATSLPSASVKLFSYCRIPAC